MFAGLVPLPNMAASWWVGADLKTPSLGPKGLSGKTLACCALASYLANVEIARKCGKDSSNHRNSTFYVVYIAISATCYNQRYKGAFPLALSLFSISSRPPAP
jgi:hypothetical protein